MKITTGIDIIEVERIKKAINEMGNNFLNRIYTENEIEYSSKSEIMKYQHLAARFAAKEAVFKAVSGYIDGRSDALWKDIELINIEGGKPEINVEKLVKNINKTANVKLKDIDVSISHIKEYAVASVVAVFEEIDL